MSQITTHILDTSAGKPVKGVSVILYILNNDSLWEEISSGITNEDGRIKDLITENKILNPGTYKLKFLTGAYYAKNIIRRFYPFIEIIFEIENEDHYHIPLLLNPFGYTTYRGS